MTTVVVVTRSGKETRLDDKGDGNMRSLHLVVEDLPRGSRREVLVKYIKNILTDVGEFGLNILSVALGHRDSSLVTLPLFLRLNQ